MIGVKLNGNHSYRDYGLVLSSKNIGAPEPKTNLVDIVGGDGVIDLTDFFGETKYGTRELILTFSKAHNTNAEFIADWQKLLSEFLGKKISIVFDEDSDFFYTGRVNLSYTREKNIATITFTITADPYKLKNDETVISYDGSGDVVLQNLRKTVIPTIHTTAETVIVFGESRFVFNAGTHIAPDIMLVAGDNDLVIESEGITTFRYREGSL